MRLASALLAVAAMPLAAVAGVQHAEAPQASSLAATMAGAYGVISLGLWLAAEVAGRKARRGGGWR